MRKRFYVGMTVCVCVGIAVLGFANVSSAQIFADQMVIPGPGCSSHSVAAGDLNGDGAPDVVTLVHEPLVCSGRANVFQVLLNANTGSGSLIYDTNKEYDTNPGPYSVVLAKLNRDDFLDVVTVNQNDFVEQTVTVGLNRGNGTFSSIQHFPAGRVPAFPFVTPADFDGDGDVDLAVGDSGRLVSVLWNNGFGAFGSVSGYGDGAGSSTIAAADLNGDGKPDLAVASFEPGVVRVLLNEGSRRFRSLTPVMVAGLGPDQWIVAANLDRDGKKDLAVCSGNKVTVLFNDGHGAFPSRTSNLVGDSPNGLAAADVDCDGDLDLVTANAGSHNVSVLLNDGHGIFALEARPYASGSYPTSVAVADFNGDQSPDLAVPNHNGDGTGGNGSLSIFLGFGCHDLPRACCHGGDFTATCEIANYYTCRESGGVPLLPGTRCEDRFGNNICVSNIIVPAVSDWRLVILTLLVLMGIALKFGRRRAGSGWASKANQSRG